MPPTGRPFDEAAALALLRAGTPAYKVRRTVGGGMRRIVELARANGIKLHHRRTNAELRSQEAVVRAKRSRGRSWQQIARDLGYNVNGAPSIRRRMDNIPTMHASRLRAIFVRLIKANKGRAGWDDIPSFLRMAASERMHWLLTPAEIELARRFRLLPEHCMGERASVLIERSLHMPPATPRPVRTDYMDN